MRLPSAETLPARRLVAAFLLLVALPSFAASAPRNERAAPFPPEENYVYNVHFLFFKNAATGNLKIRRIGELRYRAELVAETKGFIGVLTAHRKNHYISEMEFDPVGRRLMTRIYTKTVYRGLDVSRIITVIDREKGEIHWRVSRNGALKDKGTDPIPKGVIYDDLLSAFFNLRFGAYGPLTRGRYLKVRTLPAPKTNDEGEVLEEKDRIRDFEIRLADPETERRYRERYERSGEKGLLALVKVPKELFGQETGEVRVWLDENLIPVAATVEDAILYGDVHGTLERAIVSRPPGPKENTR